jgi:hypothetical protein
MRVTLAKALVVKNRVAQELAKLNAKIQVANASQVQGLATETLVPKYQYVMNDLLNEQEILANKLVQIKLQISLANKDEKQQTRIFRLSELKSLIATLNVVSTAESRVMGGGYRTDPNIVTQVFVQMNEKQKEEKVKKLQEEIDTTQEAMEKFNWQTEINIPE